MCCVVDMQFISVFLCICESARVYVCTQFYVHVYVCVFVHACLHVCVGVCGRVKDTVNRGSGMDTEYLHSLIRH